MKRLKAFREKSFTVLVVFHLFMAKYKKLTHAIGFLCIALVLTWVGERGLAKFSLIGFLARLLHLGGELVADRFVGRGFFHEGE